VFDSDHVYAFDIETDNSAGHGLDPRKAAITQISVVGSTLERVLTGDEVTLLDEFAEVLAGLDAGLIVGWNSTFFDWPFIATRMKVVGPTGLNAILELTPQPALRPKYDFTPGHTCGYSAIVATDTGTHHAHLDVSLAWKAFAESFGTREDGTGRQVPVVPWSLKPVAKAAGIDMFELDRTRLHEYTPEETARYVLSDAIGTRELALRTLGLA